MGKSEDFSEWYNDVIQRAGLRDKRYPLKGMDVWLPYGVKVRTLMDGIIRAEMEATGHGEVEFPLAIPQTEFQKEADHIKGFGGQVYWITHGGETPLEVPLVLRPTSETAMYPLFAVWVRSHADLPMKVFQIVKTYRYETKQTRTFIRVREIHFFEAHTCHADYADAEAQVVQDLEIVERYTRSLGLPHHLNRRPEWDKFPGAHYSIGADVVMPLDAQTGHHRCLQVATVHHYAENFAKPYDITYETEGGDRKHVHQTTYGMSERVLGAVVGLHGDDRGIMLPPAIAPVQCVVIPIPFRGREDEVNQAADRLARTLKAAGIRAVADLSDQTPGWKYNEYELRGVPIRLELGPRDLDKGSTVLVRRDLAQKDAARKRTLPLDAVVPGVQDALVDVALNLHRQASALKDQAFQMVEGVDAARKYPGVAALGWCGKTDCGLEIEKAVDKTVLGTPVVPVEGTLRDKYPPEEGRRCVHCGTGNAGVMYVAKTY